MFDILLITGAAGTGKTSTAQAWASSRQITTAHLSHDALMLNVKSGMASPAEQVTVEAERQWHIAREIAIATCQIYAAAQVRCVIDTFLLPRHLDLWHKLAPLQVGIVVLQPAVETALARNTARLAQTGWGVPSWQVQANHLAMAAWLNHPDVLFLDTSNLEIAEVVDAIDAWERGQATNSEVDISFFK